MDNKSDITALLLLKAVVLQTVKDYAEALKKLKHPDDLNERDKKKLEREIKNCEMFFECNICTVIFNLNSEYLINKIKHIVDTDEDFVFCKQQWITKEE